MGGGYNWLKWWGEICPKSGGGQRITLFSVYFANKLPYPRGGGGGGKGVIRLYNVRKFSGLGAMTFLTQLMTVLSSEIRNLGYSMNQNKSNNRKKIGTLPLLAIGVEKIIK